MDDLMIRLNYSYVVIIINDLFGPVKIIDNLYNSGDLHQNLFAEFSYAL